MAIADGTDSFSNHEEVPFTKAQKDEYVRLGETPPEENFWDLVYTVDVVLRNQKVEEVGVFRTETA